jgi:hypothetical protein
MRLQRMCPVVPVDSARTLELGGLIGHFSDQAPVLAGAYPRNIF